MRRRALDYPHLDELAKDQVLSTLNRSTARNLTAHRIFCFCLNRAPTIYTIFIAISCLLLGLYLGTFVVTIWNGYPLIDKDRNFWPFKPISNPISSQDQNAKIQG